MTTSTLTTALPTRLAVPDTRPAADERIPRWALALSAAMVWALELGLGLRLAAWAVNRAFSLLGFCEVMASSKAPEARAGFVRGLLRTVRAKLLDGSLARRPVTRWVAALLTAAWRMPLLARRFERRHGFAPPAFLVVTVTERCNFRCAHCYEGSEASRSQSLDYATFERLLVEQREQWGAPMVAVTGGEPFLYRDPRGGLLDLAAAHPSTLFIVYTNGTRIDGAVAARLAELGNVVPLISLEGDEAHTAELRGPRAWPAAMSAMRHLRANGALFGLSITAGRANAALLADPAYFRALRDEHGATFFWLLERAPMGRGEAGREDLLSLEEKGRLQASLREMVAGQGFLLVSFLHAPGPFSGCLGAGRADGFFHVDASGDVKHCVYSPLRLGNARESFAQGRPLSDFLFTPRAAALRKAQVEFFAAGDLGRGHRPCPAISSIQLPNA